MKKIIGRTLAALGIAAMAGPAACTDQKPEKSWLETYAEKFPKDYAEYYLRFFHAYSCRPADNEAEELYDKVVQSAIRTHTFSGTFLGGFGRPEDITRSGWWDMAYVKIERMRSKSNGKSTGESKSISRDGKNNSVGYTGNYAGNDEISLRSLRLERVYPSYLDDNNIVRLVQNFNDGEISGLGIKTVADLNRFLTHTCRLVSGYDMRI